MASGSRGQALLWAVGNLYLFLVFGFGGFFFFSFPRARSNRGDKVGGLGLGSSRRFTSACMIEIIETQINDNANLFLMCIHIFIIDICDMHPC